VKKESYDIACVRVSHYLINKLTKPRVAQESALNRLFLELRELAHEQLLWSWQLLLYKH
jgi:hypothetical protein